MKIVFTLKNTLKPILFVAFAIAAGALFYSLNSSQIILNDRTNNKSARIQIEGNVKILVPGAGNWSEPLNNQEITTGTQIKTSASSQAQITYPNGTITRLDEKTQITLKAFEIEPQKVEVSLSQGKIWSSVTKLLGKEASYQTESPTVVATVRGTKYLHEFLPDGKDNIVVTESKVEISCKNKNSTKKAEIEEGNTASSDCKKNDGEIKVFKTPKDLLNNKWLKENEQKDLEEVKIKKESEEKTSKQSLIQKVKDVFTPKPKTGPEIKGLEKDQDKDNKNLEKNTPDKDKDKKDKSPEPTVLPHIPSVSPTPVII